MATFCDVAPFGDEPLAEVPLENPPLVAVIAQVRFPPIASIAEQSFIGPFQEELRPTYPVLRPEREVRLAFTPDGPVPTPESNVVWRLTDIEQNWRVSLAPSFLSIDVDTYTSRKEFVARFRAALQALHNHIKPQLLDRLGVRYVDRIELSDDVARLHRLIRPEVLGAVGHDFGDATLSRSIADSEIRSTEGIMRARWGVLPAHTALDSFHGEPPATPSWLLDLDMFTSKGSRSFEVAEAAQLAELFAERIYRVFRWAVSDELLELFGAKS